MNDEKPSDERMTRTPVVDHDRGTVSTARARHPTMPYQSLAFTGGAADAFRCRTRRFLILTIQLAAR